MFGRTYAAEPDKLVKQLKEDEAIAEAGVDVSDETRDRIATHIEQRGGREDVAELL